MNPEYQILREGETLQAGDEVKMAEDTWIEIPPSLIGLVVRHAKRGGGFLPEGFYRRPVKISP